MLFVDYSTDMSDLTTILRKGIASATNGTVTKQDQYTPTAIETGWLPGATLWLLDPMIHAVPGSEETIYSELYEHRRPVNDVDVPLQELTEIRFKNVSEEPDFNLKIGERRRYARYFPNSVIGTIESSS